METFFYNGVKSQTTKGDVIMLDIKNLEEWTRTYFEQPENIKKAEKACEHYDRIMVTNVRKQLMSGSEQIDMNEIAKEDPGKRLARVKYEVHPAVKVDGKKGKLKVNLIDRTAEFIAID